MKKKVVQIQRSLLRDLKANIEQCNKPHKPTIKLDLAVFYISLFNSLPSFHRTEDEDEEQAVIRLDSQILKKYNRNYNIYIHFLIDNQFIIKVKSYGADIKQCNSYILNPLYMNSEVVCYVITDRYLLDKFDNQGIENFYADKMKYCKKTRPHLVKFFNDKLRINTKQANDIIAPILQENESKYLRAKQLLLEIYYQQWRYSIKPDTDSRLHSNLTRLNRVLRAALTYDGHHLGAIDIKSSQPYFFAVILKAIYLKDKSILKQIGATKLLNQKQINTLFDMGIDKAEMIRFISPIVKDDFYTSFAKKLKIKYDNEGRIYRNVSNFTKKNKGKFIKEPYRKKIYETERELAKKVIMEIFYSSSKSTIPEAKSFKLAYPTITKIMNYIKEECIEFHYLLSNIEAHCLLDRVAKQFNKKYPSVPIWSIHDSLVTTKPNLKLLEKEMKQLLHEVTNLKAQVEAEPF